MNPAQRDSTSNELPAEKLDVGRPLLDVECWKMNVKTIIANGKSIEASLPCSIEEFLVAQKLLPRSVVVEHNGAYGVKRPRKYWQLNPGGWQLKKKGHGVKVST
jgi:sulfur carrier protein ThiS